MATFSWYLMLTALLAIPSGAEAGTITLKDGVIILTVPQSALWFKSTAPVPTYGSRQTNR